MEGQPLKQQPFTSKLALLRWRIIRNAFIGRRFPISEDDEDQMIIKRISRKTSGGFNLIQFHQLDSNSSKMNSPSTTEDANRSSREVCIRYLLPIPNNPELFLTQRVDNYVDINDFEICKKYDIDNTGLVCKWPTEEVLAHFCITHADSFRGKRVIELGSGYGLAGLATAVATEAAEVVISDGNPQVVDYIGMNVEANYKAFGGTKVSQLLLHWNGDIAEGVGVFDVVIASDCFFKECHKGLVKTIKKLLRGGGEGCEALIFGPRRGDSMEMFMNEVRRMGLHCVVEERYDNIVWSAHQRCVSGGGNPLWLNYEEDHCYPLLVRVTFQPEEKRVT